MNSGPKRIGLFRLSILCLLTAFVLVSCRGAVGNPDSAEIVIGEYGSLTGSAATFGISTRNGIDMAVEHANQGGGLLGKKIRMVVEDDQGKPEEAQTVVTRLISRSGAVAVLGEFSSSRTMAAAPVAQSAGVPMISHGATNPKVTRVGDYIFRICFIDPFQGAVMARFAVNTLKVKNVAIFRDIKNDYSVGLADVFIENFRKLAGIIVADESYGEGDTDFNAQLTKIKSRHPDALFIPGYYSEVGLIAQQARKQGLTVPLLGGDGWDSPKLLEIGGDALDGSYYSNHYTVDNPGPAVQAFVSAYRVRHGTAPDAPAALGFDAANVVFDAIRRAGSTEGAKLRDAIAATKDYSGVTGAITLDRERNAVKPAVVLRIKGGKTEYVETVNP